MIPVRIERRNVKNINLYLRAPYQEVLVTAPPYMAQSRIDAFIREKSSWIERNLERLKAREAEDPLTKPLDAAEKKRLNARLNAILPPFLETWAERMDVSVSAWQLRVMRRCWGVCHCRAHTITFNTHLGAKPEECIEYVVVHELCHLLEPSHNARFHRLMDTYLPDWKLHKKRLNE